MENSLNQHKIYKGIDLFKLIAAILIVLLHTIETSDFYANEVKFVITRLAVPFFFIASGFFFYKGLNNTENKKKYFIKYEKNLLLLFLVWAVLIYSPFTISSYINDNPDSSAVYIAFLLIRRIFIIGPGAFWYLLALIISIAFIYLCYKKKLEKLLLFSMAFGFILTILYTNFNSALSNISVFNLLFKGIYYVFSWEFNFIMYGIPFCGLGFIFSKYNININLRNSIILLAISTVLRVIEYNLPLIFSRQTFFQENQISFFYVLQAIFFFYIALNINPSFSSQTSKNIRQLSSFIYFSHTIILYNIMNPLLENMFGSVIYDVKYIFPKMLLVLVICFIIYSLIRKINNKYLNILING